MNRIEKRKLYLDYLEEINEGKSREKKIAEAVQKIKKFLVNDKIINFLIKEIVDTETSKGVKYLVWLANHVKDEILSQAKKEDENFYANFKKYIETGKSDDVEEFESFINQQLDDTYYDDYFDVVTIGLKVPHIMDWIKSPIRQGDIDLSKYKTLNNVFDEAKEWHKELRATGHIQEEHGKIIKSFDDGYYWIDLETKSDADEASAMGHCGVTNEGTTLYSLRKAKSPHVTMAIDEERGFITQCKGRRNEKPIMKYHKYIVDLMLDENFKADRFYLEYDTGDDFLVDDLNDELYIKLLSHNPRWLYKTSDIVRFYTLLKDNIDVFKKLETINLFEIIYQNKDDKNINNLTNILIGKEFSYPEIDGHLEINSDFVIVDCKFCLKLLRYEVRFQLLLSPHSNFDSNQCYRTLLKNFYDFDLIMKDVKSDTTLAKTISNQTISKVKDPFKDWATRVREIYNSYVQNIFPDKMKTEIELIFKTIKDKTEIDVFKKGEHYVFKMPIMTFLDNIFRTKYAIHFPTHGFYKATSISDGLSNLYKNITKEFNNLRYEPQYNFITEINEYILDNIDKVNESVINEKFGVADDIEEWYDLIYYIITIQLNAFVDAVKKEPEMFEKILEIDEDEVNVYTAEISVQKEINKLITKYIKKTNKLKLKNLALNLSITILPLENFSNYIFPTDAYYNDSDAYFDGTHLNECEIYLELYLPDEILDDENVSLVKIMNDYEINLKLRQSLSHELDHAYEFFNRIKTGNAKIPETELNKIRSTLSDAPFSQISQDFLEFLNLIYISMSFEGSARITQIYFQLKEYKIDNETYFWSIVKNSFGWKDLESLKDFNPVEFYNNIKFEISDNDIKEALIECGVYKSEDFEKTTIKLLVIRHWLKIFDKLIEDVNKNTKVKLPRINKQMFDHPVLFFKYYDKKFKLAWQHFYNRIVKMSVLYVKPKNRL